MKTNSRPYYYASPYWIPANKGNPKPIPGLFSIYENRDGKSEIVVDRISNLGDRLNNLLKRGIPLENARTLFYQMD